MRTKARILVSIQLDGVGYMPNQVVEFPSKIAKALATEGQIDTASEAVSYCINDLGQEVIVHETKNLNQEVDQVEVQ